MIYHVLDLEADGLKFIKSNEKKMNNNTDSKIPIGGASVSRNKVMMANNDVVRIK